jgi:hypothetical protein
MATTKLFASTLSKKLEEKKAIAKEKVRSEKIEADKNKKRLEKIEADRKAEEEYLRLMEMHRKNQLELVARIALPMALGGRFEVGLAEAVLDECSEYLEELGFSFGKLDCETHSIICLDKTLRSLNKSQLRVLYDLLRNNSQEFIKVSSADFQAKLLRILEVKDPFLFCDKFFIFMKKNLRYQDEILDPEDFETLEPGDLLLNQEKNKKFNRLAEPVFELLTEYVPGSLNPNRYIKTMLWNKKSNIPNYDFWFNVNTLYWMSSKAGNNFFEVLLQKIEMQLDLLKSNINIELFDQKNKTTIRFKDDSEISTPLVIDSLSSIFECLGYKLVITPPRNITAPYKIKMSWT